MFSSDLCLLGGLVMSLRVCCMVGSSIEWMSVFLFELLMLVMVVR